MCSCCWMVSQCALRSRPRTRVSTNSRASVSVSPRALIRRTDVTLVFDNVTTAGVSCLQAMAAPNNVIARNNLAGSTSSATAQVAGPCTYPTSIVQADFSGLAFVHSEAPGPFSYKLTSGATGAIDQAIDNVSSARSTLGAQQNDLEHTTANLNVSAENQLSAQSRIQDLDFAKGVSDQTRGQILSDVGAAVLAQANFSRQSVVQLLR